MVIFSEIKKDSLSYNLDKNDVQKEQKNLADKVKKRDDVLKLFAKKADLGFGNSDNSALSENGNLIKEKIEKKFENENTARSELLKHPQVQSFLNKYIADYSAGWTKKNDTSTSNETIKSIKNDSMEQEEETIESLDEYMSHELSPDKLEEFLLSDEGIRILKDEIDDHVDEEGNLYNNFRISNKNLRIKLETARRNSIRKRYNQKYNIHKEDEKDDIRKMGNLVATGVSRCVVKYLKEGKSEFNGELIKSLETLLSDDENKKLIEKLEKDSNFRYEFKLSLRESIKRYSNIVLKNNNVSLNSGDAQIDLHLKSYLYLYGKLFFPKIFKTNQGNQYYERILPEIMAAILAADDKRLEKIIRNNEFLEQEKRDEEARKKRDKERRREIAKRNREINERGQSMHNKENKGLSDTLQTKSDNLNNLTGAEIAANANLGESLKDYKLNIQESKEKQQWIKEVAFSRAWKEFIKIHDDMKTLITQRQMHGLFDINSNMLDISKWKIFKENNPLLKDMPPDKVEEIRIILSGFSSYLNNYEKILSNNSSERKDKIDETVKTYAIGAVIDDVRNTFNIISNKQNGNFKGFEFNDKEPVKRLGDGLIISGSFNGSNIKIRYDLKTGELFINSFLHKLSPTKITIGDNSLIDYPVGMIKPFNDILNENYKFSPTTKETHSPASNHRIKPGHITNINNSNNNLRNPSNPHEKRAQTPPILRQKLPANRNLNSKKHDIQNLLNSQIDLIGNAVISGTEKQTAKNSAIMGFMKTFNIIRTDDSENFKSVDFNEGSNLFRFIQIIDRTANDINESSNGAHTLEYFTNTFMPLLMKYSGLQWGENNMKQEYNNIITNQNIEYLRNKVGKFNPEQFSGVGNFTNTHQLRFIELIEEKLLDSSNTKLDITKMQKFIESVEGKDSEDPDEKLSRNLERI